MLLVVLTTFLLASCGTEAVKFRPNFFEFVTKDGGYITNASKTEKYYCDEPRIRKNFAALHIDKIKELKKILRNARVPRGMRTAKKRMLNNLATTINKMKD